MGGKFPVTPPWITRLHRFPDCCSDVMKEGERNFSIRLLSQAQIGGQQRQKRSLFFSPCTNLPIQHQR